MPSPNFRNKYQPLRLSELERTKRLRLALPIRRYSTSIPFGYKPHPGNPDVLIPIDREFKLLCVASVKIQKGEFTFTHAAEWLSASAGRSISRAGLHKLLANRPPHPSVILPLKSRIQLYDFYCNYYSDINEIAMLANDTDSEGNITNKQLLRALNGEVDIYLEEFIEEEGEECVERYSESTEED